MFRRIRSAAISFVLFAAASLSAAAQSTGSVAQRIDDFVAPFAEASHFSGVVLASKDGKVLFEKGYGFANAENKVPNSVASRFSIASISKPMTVVILVKLMESGKLGLDDKLSKFVPDFPRGDEITVGMLARHTSGIPHRITTPEQESSASSPAKMVELAKNAKLAFEPGKGELYSSAGYSVLARVLEIASGKTYGGLLREFVLDPAKMRDSGEYESREVIRERAADYLLEGDKWVTGPLTDFSFLVGAGSVFSTAHDVFRFGSMIADGGFGEAVKANFVRNGVFSSNGNTNGYRANIRIDTNTGIGYVLVSNLGSGANDVIIRSLPDLVAGNKVAAPVVPAPKVDRSTKNQLSDYAGRYKLGSSGFEVFEDERELFAGPYKLLPLGKDRFYSFWSYAEITFERDSKGIVTGLKWEGSAGTSEWKRE